MINMDNKVIHFMDYKFLIVCNPKPKDTDDIIKATTEIEKVTCSSCAKIIKNAYDNYV